MQRNATPRSVFQLNRNVAILSGNQGRNAVPRNATRRQLYANLWLAPLTRLLAPDCLLRSRPPLRSLVRSLAHFTHSLARGKVNY